MPLFCLSHCILRLSRLCTYGGSAESGPQLTFYKSRNEITTHLLLFYRIFIRKGHQWWLTISNNLIRTIKVKVIRILWLSIHVSSWTAQSWYFFFFPYVIYFLFSLPLFIIRTHTSTNSISFLCQICDKMFLNEKLYDQHNVTTHDKLVIESSFLVSSTDKDSKTW